MATSRVAAESALDTSADADDMPTVDIDTMNERTEDVSSPQPSSARRRSPSFRSNKGAVKYSPDESCWVDVLHEELRDKLGKTYKGAINSLVHSKDDISKRKKIAQALEEFMYFFYVAPGPMKALSSDDVNSLLQVLVLLLSSADDKKYHSHLRYINVMLSDLRLDTERYDRTCIALKRELAKDFVLHKAYSLRTIDKLSLLSGKSSDLLRDTIAVILKTFVKSETETKSRFKAALNITDKEEVDKLFLVRTALLALQRHPQAAESTTLQYIIQVTRSKDTDCAREALAAMLILAGTVPQVLMPLKARLPKFVLTDSPLRYTGMAKLKEDKRAAYHTLMNVEDDAVSRAHVANLCSIVIGGDRQLARVSRGGLAQALEVQQQRVAASPSPDSMNLDSLLASPTFNNNSNNSNSSSTGLVPPQLVTVENDEFVNVTKYLLHDESLLVFMETVRVVCRKFNFAVFFEKDVVPPPPKGSQVTHAALLAAAPSVLEYVVERLCDCLVKHGQQVLVHAAARVAMLLASSAMKYAFVYPDKITKEVTNVLYRLLPPLDSLLIHECSFVRLQVYKAMLWLSSGSAVEYNPDDGSLMSSIIERLKIELQGQVLNNLWRPYHVHDLLVSLAQHVQVDELVFGAFSELCVFVFVNMPDKLIPSSLHLSALFSEILLVKNEDVTSGFLKMVYNILDCSMRGTTDSLALHRVLYTFLAEIANRVCKEPSPTPPPPPPSATATASSAGAELDAAALKRLLTNPVVFDVHNAAMKTILLRLMSAAMHHTQEIRASCIEGLGKIAFRSLDPIRLFIYQFLSSMAAVSELGLSTQCTSILLVLDEVYKLQQYFAVLISKTFSENELLTFFAVHERVKEKIGFFCKFPLSFLPLGLSSRPYLTQAFEIHQKRKQVLPPK